MNLWPRCGTEHDEACVRLRILNEPLRQKSLPLVKCRLPLESHVRWVEGTRILRPRAVARRCGRDTVGLRCELLQSQGLEVVAEGRGLWYVRFAHVTLGMLSNRQGLFKVNGGRGGDTRCRSELAQ